MTAVEWLEQELDKNFEIRGNSFLFDKILNQAKEMEKKQKIEFASYYTPLTKEELEIGFNHKFKNQG